MNSRPAPRAGLRSRFDRFMPTHPLVFHSSPDRTIAWRDGSPVTVRAFVADVARVAAASGTLVISPNMNPSVIEATVAAGLVSLPGISTPTEAFAAIEAGAAAIKLFPAEGSSPAILKAMRAVLPAATALYPVGGITPEGMAAYRAAGAAGFGLGSALYVPGRAAADVALRAAAFRDAWRRLGAAA